ncbi:PAS domain S-box protein [Methylicorpusculum oleiharenae]|uniref:PAS domain S-box protein n=1 Tax=Methylicorpusculum oleiharenae TaxID=1338687 RepID=UPI00135B4737|nr:PAS domain S-box protein [Methylicorpusculum oleiharenae]MCD2450749.1 PAS domain S-box protein [Methylicorpusculum oleiharenae]
MMIQTIMDFLGVKNFTPHGYCLSWDSTLLWLHVASGAVIAFSYFLIPLVIFSFIRQRKGIPYSNVFLMFCAFIVACGMTHVISVITIWIPLYWLDGWVKALTAVLSLMTLIVVFRVVPQALELPDTVTILRNEIREREKAEHAKNAALTALQASEERLRLVLEGAELGFWDWDIETDKVERNEIWARMLGYSPEELKQTSRQWAELIHPDDKEKVWQSLTDTLEGRSLVHKVEYRMFHKDGSIKWILDHGSVMEIDVNGKAKRMTGTQSDISERRQAEEALLKSRHDLNRAQAVAHIGSWRMDVCNNRLQWSDENYRIFGLPIGTPLNYQSFLEIVHPADLAFVDAAWQDALIGKSYDIEHRLLIDGKTKWVRELAELEFDEQGLLLGAFGTTEDITDIKSSQEALQQERAFLRQVIDATPSMIFVKDRKRRFLLSNEALAKCYGTNADSLIGLTDDQFNPNSDEVAKFCQDDLEVINTAQAKFIPEEKVTHADGSVHWFSTIKIPLIDDDNSCNKLLGVSTDITERKRAEEALLLADRRKDEFLAMLAHELRNPLAPIRNAVQFLKLQQLTDPKQAWGLNVIDRQVSNIARLLDDLLDVARIMQGKITLKPGRLELGEIANAALEISRPLIELRRQELIISQTFAPLWIEGDRVRLEQVLSNLLNNASKYTGEGGKIMLSVSREGSNAVIEIKDTGIGIPSGTLPHIFDLFIQADNSLAHSQGGLGIGLTLVRRLTEMHGGTVSAVSPGIGKGSTFVVKLPSLPLESSPQESATPLSVLPMPKFRILIVDDYADVAESLTMLLEIYGHELKSADCGAKAIECAQIFSPQVVLIDIGLPDMNGYEVAKRLRQLPVTQDALLIALSGYGMAVGGELSQSSEFDHYLLKPLELEKLLTILNAFQQPSG